VQAVKGVSNIVGRYISCTYRRLMQPYFFSSGTTAAVIFFAGLMFSYASIHRLVKPYSFALSTTCAAILLIDGF
jgi:hypothetical protein